MLMITVLERYIEQKKLEFTRLDVKAAIFLLVITMFILISPFLFRTTTDLLIGKDTYYFLRIAENPFIKFDELSYGGIPYVFSAWPIIINLFNKVFGPSLITTAKILSVLLGLVSSILFYFIARKFMNTLTSLLSALILVLSPTFLYSFSTLTDFSFIIFLSLIILFFIFRNNNFAIFLLLLIPLFGILHTIIFGFLLILYSLSRKEIKWLSVIPIYFIAIMIYLFVYGLPSILLFNATENKVLI